jgi:hypothetical protein
LVVLFAATGMHRESVLLIENTCEQGMEVDIWTHVGFESDWRLVKVA